MITIKNLTKIYTPKKGVPVKALDNLNVSFEDKGLIFLLGKSGSGKSTLLNCVGGLDVFNSGEIIIKGKSSASFKPGDFDSYRNTFIGFVFQEYNILQDFTVARNIGLALELQGKPAHKKDIDNILEQVDLKGYGSRKPNELSGGQKQRIAIARALIKDPEIIMADEPTGALDSKTGKQVFETLKKLAKSKLVIVVSHDRENAEKYADRIIELADGKIISDTKKQFMEPNSVNVGIDIVDDKILRIKKGYKYTKKDLVLINSFLENSNTDTIISKDSESNLVFKQVSGLNDEMEKECFKETKSLKLKKYSEKDFKLIKSRLPYKDSVRIGASSLKNKKIRLLITIILATVSFTLFGLADTVASYNKYNATLNSLRSNNIEETAIVKEVQVYNSDYDYFYPQSVKMSDIDVAKIQTDNPKFEFAKVQALADNIYTNYVSINNLGYVNNSYYKNKITGISALSLREFNNFNLIKLAGTHPKNNDEVAISKYTFECLKKLKLKDVSTNLELTINTYNDVLNKLITFNVNDTQVSMKIVAVYDTHLNEQRYSVLENSTDYNLTNYMLMNEFETLLNSSFHAVLFSSAQAIENLPFAENYYENGFNALNQINSFNYSYFLPVNDEYKYYITLDSDKTLKDNELFLEMQELVSYNLPNIIIDNINASYSEHINNAINSINGYIDENIDELAANPAFNIDAGDTANNKKYIIKQALTDINNPLFYSITMDQVIFPKLEKIVQTYLNSSSQKTIKLEPINKIYTTTAQEFDIKGVYVNLNHIISRINSTFYSKPYLIFNQNNMDIIELSNGKIGCLLTNFTADYDTDMSLILYGDKVNAIEGSSSELRYLLINPLTEGFNMLNSMIESMAEVFLYVAIGFMVFTALMLLNYITISISYKKHEIGILRALGARSSDVFGIFFNESLIITLVNYVLSIISVIVTSVLLNNMLKKSTGILIQVLSVGIRQFFIMLIACVVIAALATYLPVKKFAKKNPIDAINNR